MSFAKSSVGHSKNEGQKKRKRPEDESSSSKPYKKPKFDQDLNDYPYVINVVP